MESGVVLNIMSFSTRDGPGIRTTVFLKGCPLHCRWCHNPESQKTKPELMLRPNLCVQCGVCLEVCPEGAVTLENGLPVTHFEQCTGCGTCAAACYTGAREMVGEQMTVDDVMRRIHRDLPFWDESGGGVTFSGGEPLLQADFLQALLRSCKHEEIHTTVDTSAFASWETLDRLREWVDLFLVDVKSLDESVHQKMTGVPLAPIITNLQRLTAAGHLVMIRVPLIPGVNADEKSMQQLANLCHKLARPVSVELLPYHRSGVEKYRRLGRDYDLANVMPPTQDVVLSLAEVLRNEQIEVRIGG